MSRERKSLQDSQILVTPESPEFVSRKDPLLAAEAARGQFSELRSSEPAESGDRVLLLVHSGVLIPGAETSVFRPISSITEEERTCINKSGEITFASLVTFGRKNGQAIFSTMAYRTVPLAESLDDISEDTALNTKRDPAREIEVGFIKYHYDHKKKDIVERKEKSGTISEVEKGFTLSPSPEVLELAESIARFDAHTAPLLETMNENFPYNSLRTSLEADNWLLKGRSDLVDDFEAFFEKYGGDCPSSAYYLAKQLEGKGIDAFMASYTMAHDNSNHVNVIASDGNLWYRLDPSMGAPAALPLDDRIMPPSLGDNTFVSYNNKLQSPPDYIAKTSKSPLWSRAKGDALYSTDFFAEGVQLILSAYPNLTTLRMQFMDKEGHLKLFLTVDITTKEIRLKLRNQKLSKSILVTELLNDPKLLENMCKEVAIDPAYVVGELSALAIGKNF